MKKSLILAGMLVVGYANAQEGNVGINTEIPKATLDIVPEKTKLNGTSNEGIIAPRLSKTRIANIAADELTEGTLVYATDDTTSPISAYTGSDVKVAKITEKGYYYYDGTEWVRTRAGDTDTTIYTHDGTFTSNRFATMDGKNLNFVGSGNNTLMISRDARLRIGRSKANPGSAIVIDGEVGGGDDDILINSYNDTRTGFSLISAKYRGTLSKPKAVGVGDFLGNWHFRGYTGKSIINGVYMNTIVREVDEVNDKIKADLYFTLDGNVGISTSTPTNKLHVVAQNDPLRLQGLQTGTGEMLVVDANGVVKKGANVSTNGVQNSTDMECNDKNRGKMNFGRVSINGRDTDALGICMMNANNQFRWYYIYGGAAHTEGTSATFGSGL